MESWRAPMNSIFWVRTSVDLRSMREAQGLNPMVGPWEPWTDQGQWMLQKEGHRQQRPPMLPWNHAVGPGGSSKVSKRATVPVPATGEARTASVPSVPPPYGAKTVDGILTSTGCIRTCTTLPLTPMNSLSPTRVGWIPMVPGSGTTAMGNGGASWWTCSSTG